MQEIRMVPPEKNEHSKIEPAKPAPAVRERDPARDKAIELAVSTIEKQFGKGSIMRLGDEIPAPEVRVVPTGAAGRPAGRGSGLTMFRRKSCRAGVRCILRFA
jgi:hypothetical protein